MVPVKLIVNILLHHVLSRKAGDQQDIKKTDLLTVVVETIVIVVIV